MKRIQRKRIKGWRMPPNTVYVGRPSKWGNPYITGKDGAIKEVLTKYEWYIKGLLIACPSLFNKLQGKDLACWCPLDKPCHADVLLKFLNKQESNSYGKMD